MIKCVFVRRNEEKLTNQNHNKVFVVGKWCRKWCFALQIVHRYTPRNSHLRVVSIQSCVTTRNRKVPNCSNWPVNLFDRAEVRQFEGGAEAGKGLQSPTEPSASTAGARRWAWGLGPWFIVLTNHPLVPVLALGQNDSHNFKNISMISLSTHACFVFPWVPPSFCSPGAEAEGGAQQAKEGGGSQGTAAEKGERDAQQRWTWSLECWVLLSIQIFNRSIADIDCW